MDKKTRVFQRAQRDGGICSICFDSLNIGDGLWPIENPQVKKHRYAHVGCAAQQVGGLDNLIPPICKHWRKRGTCAFGHSCFFLHPQNISPNPDVILNNKNSDELKVRKRKPVANGSRAFVFRVFLIDTFGLELMRQGSGVLDVGGGNGELGFQFINLNKIPATVIDPRPLRLRRFARKASFGMYTKNIFFNKYNDGEYESGCLIPPEKLVAPLHLRVLFQQVDATATGRSKLMNDEGIGASEHPPPLLMALSDFEAFECAVRHAENTTWTKKGLVHEDKGGDVEDSELEEELTERDSLFSLRATGEEQQGQPKNDLLENSKENKDLLIDQIAETLSSSSNLSFDHAQNIIQNSSIVLGLHPDQAASEIVAFATKYHKPFAVIPCCTYSQEFPFRRLESGKRENQAEDEEVNNVIDKENNFKLVTSYDDLVEWCVRNGPPGTRVATLEFEGKNKVVYWKPEYLPDTH